MQEFNNSIIWINKTQSTNKELRTRSSFLDNLSVIATYHQTNGRGQGDHLWFSDIGTNLCFSILYKFADTLPSNNAIRITKITTLALLDYLKLYDIKADIKWPNDIYVNGRKICGILIENILEGKNIKESIVGIGFNLNQTSWPKELPNPISLKELTGCHYSLKDELVKIHNFIRKRFYQNDLDFEFNNSLIILQ